MKFHVFLFVLAALVAGASINAANIAVEEGIVCPRNQSDTSFVVQIPSPSNCGIFYKCDRGQPRVNKCPEGLHYSKRLMACDFPSRAKCSLQLAE
ncbi:PREDICTED: peritrophin-1-like [Rhagoletis zephyria]|uniref:peritrophin-1-like n=1 Tax=Rhagoletis zephyria TaxID=28612 RepID=UPI0008113AAA|nr:PREDICTED: peritrophin-1-like [Rhagoletis zephyria]